MNTDKEISSTEKLLNSIRSSSDSLAIKDSKLRSANHPDRVPKIKKFAKILPFQKLITIGVDIGYSSLRLVKILHYDSQCKWLDYKIMHFDPKISMVSPEFTNFLESELNDFCGKLEKINIWTAVSIANVDVRYINIPKVPQSQISNVVYWTAKKEIQFDEKETVFDFDEKKEAPEKGSNKIAVMVYTAPKKEVEDLKILFDKCGFPLTGISIAPFAIQNLFRAKWLSTTDETVAMLYIGRELSQIDIFYKDTLALTRGIRTGTHSMVDALKEAEGQSPMDMSQAEKILFSLQENNPDSFSLKKEQIFEMIKPVIERLVKQTERTLEYYSVTLKKQPANRFFVYGHIAAYKPLVEYIGNELGLKADIIDPLYTASSLSKHVKAPSSVSDRIVLAKAAGLAFSNNSCTPNMLFTYKEKKKAKDIANINKSIVLVFILFMVIGLGVSLWQRHLTTIKVAKVAELRQQLDKFKPFLNRNTVLQVAANARKQSQKNKALSNKYMGMSVISELVELTDGNIRLLSMDIALGGFSKSSHFKEDNDRPGLVLDGLILGDRALFESTLAGYLIKLDNSPLFRQPEVTKNSLEFSYKYGEVLHFILNVQLEKG